ncbi:MAG: WD40 repeat domain-containing serine/threonine protein kinase [Planctomycetia bacterium]
MDSFGFDGGQPVELAAGTDLGGVTIVRMLAEGGMGRVYEGRQRAPARPVAVKVLRDGLAGDATMRRFEQEANLLARLTHPHIAQVYTLGTCRGDGGSVPFFVMELVADALPIDRFVRDRGIPVRERVALIRRVAAAVAYGHRMGIVHRDLKPGNILVGADGEPKVIDFGVARSTDADLALTTHQTEAGQLVGTLRYMSPEQFDADTSRIGGATDVYALGLVLHELLTGELPYEVRGKPIVVAARIIRELEPQVAAGIARALRAVPGVDATATRQLAAITEKCLQKEPADRYATADAFENDLTRWLAGEPVHARPATPGERVVRWARRHRLAVVAAVMVCAAGLAAAFFSHRARHQEWLADRHRAAEREEAYCSAVQRSAAAAERRNIPIAASLLARARSLDAVPGRPIELDCLAARLDESVAVLAGHEAILRAVAAAPAGDLVVTGDDRGGVCFWSVDERAGYRESRRLEAHDAAIWAAAVSSDGRLVATAAADGTASVRDAAAGRVVCRLEGHADAIYGLAFAPNGRRVATAAADGTICLWETDSGLRRRVFTPRWRPGANDRNVYGVAFTPGGDRLAAACGDGVIRLWRTETGEPLAELQGHARRVFAVCFSPDGKSLASASEDGTARLWDVETGVGTRVLRHPLRVNAVAWTAEGSGLATASADGLLRLWNAASGTVDRAFVGHRDGIWSLARLPTDRFVTASSDATARVWDMEGRDEPVMDCGGTEGGGIRGVACAADGRLVATATGQGMVRLWDPTACVPVMDLPPVRGRVNAVDFSPTGGLLAAACGDGTVRRYGVDDGGERRCFDAHSGPAFAAAFSPDGRRLATAGAEREQANPERHGQPGRSGETGAVRILTVASLDGVVLTLPHPARVHAAAWSPDGRRLATACADRLVREWEAATGRLVGSFRGHADDVNWVAWSRDGSRLASASSDGTVRLWDPANGWSSSELAGPVGQVWEVAFSPDGTRVAGVGADGSLHLWHVTSGRHLLALDGHGGPLWSVAFTPDGSHIVTGCEEGTARVWGLSAREVQARRAAAGP